MREPIVVTGMGVVSPLGCSVDGLWRRLFASESGLRRLPDDIVPVIDAKVGAIVPSKDEDSDGFDPDAMIPVKDRRKMDRFIQFTLVAADQALRQSGWKPTNALERVRTATVVASGIGGFQSITDAVETVRVRGAPQGAPLEDPVSDHLSGLDQRPRPIQDQSAPPHPGTIHRRPHTLHADKAYDARARRQECRARGIVPRIARRGIESREKLGRHRWVVEGTHAWFNRFRRLPVRYERRADIYQAFTTLAACIITLNQIRRFC